MNPKATLFCLYVILPTIILTAQTDFIQLSYINSYKDIAIREMARKGIPSSITLAQAILESNAGQSGLARMANNHFGIKCGSNWTGPTFQKKDDDFAPDGALAFSCFRAYPTVEASFQDHSDFLADPQKAYRYGALFALDKTDYQSWAIGLKQAGYATSASYPDKLIGLIQRYSLQQYDRVLPAQDSTFVVYLPFTTTTNDVPNTFASGFETAGDIAYRTRMPVERLMEYNEELMDGYVLPQGEKVYLSPKRNAFKGPLDYHIVKPGETLYDISHKYGIHLDKLQARNRLEPGQQPDAGQAIKLRGGKVAAPPAYYFKPDTGFDQDERPGRPSPYTPSFPSTEHQPGNWPNTDNPSPQPEASSLPILFHLVQKGDTLWNIAQRYNTSVEQLKQLNGLNDNTIFIGMQLRIQ